jgi:hypothetical protein
VVAVLATATPFENLEDHGARDDISPSEVFGVGRVAFHEAFAVFVNEVAAFASAALGDERAGTVNAGWVELPHFHILHGEACAQSHANPVAGIDQGIRRRRVDPACAARSEHCRL